MTESQPERTLKDAIELLKNARMEYFHAVKTGNPDEPFIPSDDTVMAYYAPNVGHAIKILEALEEQGHDRGLAEIRETMKRCPHFLYFNGKGIRIPEDVESVKIDGKDWFVLEAKIDALDKSRSDSTKAAE